MSGAEGRMSGGYRLVGGVSSQGAGGDAGLTGVWVSRGRWGGGKWGLGGQAGPMPPAAQGPRYKSRPVRSPSHS